jgi:hypothetical protein
MRNLPFSAVVLVGCVALGGTLWGQNAPEHARDGGTIERIQSIEIPPIPNAPFTAVVVTEWTRILPDGSTALMKNHRTIARDTLGRVFEERRYFSPEGDKQTTLLTETDYEDLTQHQWMRCFVNTKVCSVTTYNRPLTVSQPQAQNSSENGMKWEDLGQKVVDNLNLIGSREVMTIGVGAIGNEKEQPVVKEFWYSPRLGINVTTKRFDPRASTVQNFYVISINQGEPDAQLFHPPTAYRVVNIDGVQGILR